MTFPDKVTSELQGVRHIPHFPSSRTASHHYGLWKRKAVFCPSSSFLGVLQLPGAVSLRSGEPLGPTPYKPLLWGGLCTRTAIGFGPGRGGARRSGYKECAASSLRRRVLRRLSWLLGRRKECVPASHGDEGRVCAEGRRPGAGHHPLRAEGKAWGRGWSAHLCSGAGGRPRHAPAAPGPQGRAAWGLRPAAVPRPRAATRPRRRSAESRGEPGSSGVRGEAAAG